MASRTMHLAITSMLLGDILLGDAERLMFGAVMPDAARGKESHFIVPAFGGAMNIYDLSAFRRAFGERLLSDELYLGSFTWSRTRYTAALFTASTIGTRRCRAASPGSITTTACSTPILSAAAV